MLPKFDPEKVTQNIRDIDWAISDYSYATPLMKWGPMEPVLEAAGNLAAGMAECSLLRQTTVGLLGALAAKGLSEDPAFIALIEQARALGVVPELDG